MAHSGQLRNCEELLGKLLEEQGPADARFSRNHVWLLLKGVEDFDTKRASECLVKLLINNYDTISVLKLATKRDLIDDAGILPGDALRIVAAAKEYDAPRDRGPESTSQCGHGGTPAQGVERSQDVYRPPALREEKSPFTPPSTSPSSSQAHTPAVMQPQQQNVVLQGVASWQEAVKEGKVVDQVGPRQEPVKQDPTLPPLRGAIENGKTGYALADAKFAPADPTLAPPWRALVDGRTGCAYYWNQFLNITQYNKPLRTVGSGSCFVTAPLPPGPPPSVKSAPKSAATPQTIPPNISYPHICRLCNAECPTNSQVLSHYHGQKHQVAFQKAKQSAETPIAVNPTVKETKKVAQPPMVGELKQPTQPEQAASESMQPLQSSPIAASLIAKRAAQPPVVGELKQPTQPEQAASESMQPLQSSPIAASLIAKGAAQPPVVGELKQPTQPEQAASESMQPLQSSPIAASLIAKGAAQPPVIGELKQPTQPEQAASELMQPLQSSTSAASLHACGVCNVQCYTEIVLRSHFNGNKHAKKMKTAVNDDDNWPTQYLYCSICDATFMCKRDLVMHFNGKRHADNMKEDLDSGNSSYYSDTEGSDY